MCLSISSARWSDVWDQRDAISGEDEPPAAVLLPWRAGTVTITDAFGAAHTAATEDGGG